jgi:hypothetical protein
MTELLPLTLAALLGALTWRTTKGRSRSICSVLVVLFVGGVATLCSGEYRLSWTFLLPDCGEASLGLIAGFLITQRAMTIGSRSPTRGLRGRFRMNPWIERTRERKME